MRQIDKVNAIEIEEYTLYIYRIGLLFFFGCFEWLDFIAQFTRQLTQIPFSVLSLNVSNYGPIISAV